MKEIVPYIRVGTIYYKLIERPQISGDSTVTLAKWLKEIIIQDHNKKYIFSSIIWKTNKLDVILPKIYDNKRNHIKLFL